MRALSELRGEVICAVLQLLLVLALGVAMRRGARSVAPRPSPLDVPPGEDILPNN